jgi:hypothetical protein
LVRQIDEGRRNVAKIQSGTQRNIVSMAYIYALFSGRDGLVRYVGQTANTLELRFKQHRKGNMYGYSRVQDWMYGEWEAGFPVRIEKLEWCDYTQLDERETYWINRFDGLLNTLKYYRPRWAARYREPVPKIPAITKYMRNHIFSAEGRRGIHYRRSIDMFYVLVPDRRDGFTYLEGDELPGGSGAIWFSDLARAENARDRHRSFYRDRVWVPDLAAA